MYLSIQVSIIEQVARKKRTQAGRENDQKLGGIAPQNRVSSILRGPFGKKHGVENDFFSSPFTSCITSSTAISELEVGESYDYGMKADSIR